MEHLIYKQDSLSSSPVVLVASFCFHFCTQRLILGKVSLCIKECQFLASLPKKFLPNGDQFWKTKDKCKHLKDLILLFPSLYFDYFDKWDLHNILIVQLETPWSCNLNPLSWGPSKAAPSKGVCGPQQREGKESLSPLKLLLVHWKVVGPFQAIAVWQNAQLPTSSSVYKLEITSHLVPCWSFRVLEDCADVPGAVLLLDQTKRSSWLISHDLSIWWYDWKKTWKCMSLQLQCYVANYSN